MWQVSIFLGLGFVFEIGSSDAAGVGLISIISEDWDIASQIVGNIYMWLHYWVLICHLDSCSIYACMHVGGSYLPYLANT